MENWLLWCLLQVYKIVKHNALHEKWVSLPLPFSSVDAPVLAFKCEPVRSVYRSVTELLPRHKDNQNCILKCPSF